MIKIVFFAPYPEIFTDIRRAFEKRPDRKELEYEIRQDIPNNPLENLDADVIIARGFTARSLQRAKIPCTELQVSGYDVTAAVYKCRELVPDCRKIALIGSFNMIYGAGAVNEILQGTTVTSYIIDDEKMMEKTMRQAIADGCDAVVGTHSALLQAERFGLPAVLIESGQEALTSAITHAKEAVLMRRIEQENSARIANIMNYSFQGILSTDKKGIITVANSYVYSILKLETSLLGTPLGDLFPDLPVEAVVKHGAKILSDLYRYRSMTLLINCVPVMGEGDPAGCVLTFQNITQIRRQEDAIRKKLFGKEMKARYRFTDILRENEQMEELIRDAKEYSYTNAHVMILGESGTGKELLAQSIHNESRRKTHSFVTVNCAELSEGAVERELFGYLDGAIRGIQGEKAGAFERAHQGTLFLDEVGELTPRLQSRLLRVLEQNEVNRIGSMEQIPVNVRIIASSGRDMEEEIRQERFRRDLFYRLSVLELRIPPLRERPEDLELLLSHRLSFERQKHGGKVRAIGDAAMELLCGYSWPGNVREAENFCERLSILCTRETAGPEDVLRALPHLRESLGPEEAAALKPAGRTMLSQGRAASDGDILSGRTVSGREAAVPGMSSGRKQPGAKELKLILEQFGGSRKRTAEYFGVDPSTLWRWMKRSGIR